MIVCDNCKTNSVDVNGDICDDCVEILSNPNVDDRIEPCNKVYLDDVLYKKLTKMVKDIEENVKDSKTVLGKFMKVLRSSFIDHKSGKEINNPTPMTIIPKHSTIDRIQKILNHNISNYAEQHQLETLESMEDFTIDDIYSDTFEHSIYQIVDNIEVMQEDSLSPSEEEIEETSSQATADDDLTDNDPPPLPS